jgi:Fe-S-cluster containining protein
MTDAKRVEIQLELKLGDRTINAGAKIPDVPMRPCDLLPVLLAFDDAICGAVAQIAEEQGMKISCGPRCGACCRQIVPISETEALYLAGVVESMPPERQAAVRERFRQALEALGDPVLSGLRDTSRLSSFDARREAGMAYFGRGVPCPFLEDESCSIYEHRPMSCREYFVVSPACHCSDPRPDNIQRVDLPLKLSHILFRFADGNGSAAPRWLPLVLALEEAETHRGQPSQPGPQMFRNFLGEVARAVAPEGTSR